MCTLFIFAQLTTSPIFLYLDRVQKKEKPGICDTAHRDILGFAHVHMYNGWLDFMAYQPL